MQYLNNSTTTRAYYNLEPATTKRVSCLVPMIMVIDGICWMIDSIDDHYRIYYLSYISYIYYDKSDN